MNKSFSDHESECVGFSRTCEDSKETAEIGISTTEVCSFDKTTEPVATRSIEVQTTERSSQKPATIDDSALLDFMRRFAPRVEEELRKKNKHFGSEYTQAISKNEDDIPTKKITSLVKHKTMEKGKIKHISWSCYGNKIALSVSHMKHEDWCKHDSYILIYSCDKNEEFTNEAQECIEINTCIMDMKFHPSLNSLFVLATEEGKVYYYNLSEKQENNSPTVICHNNEKITQISWVTLNSQTCLAVSGADGILSLWVQLTLAENWKQLKKFTFKSIEDTTERAINCFEFSTLNSQNFIVALERKLLLRCSTAVTSSSLIDSEFLNPTISEYDCSSTLITCIRFSLFDEYIFATASIDQQIRVHHLNEKTPISVISTEYVTSTLEWNHLQEEVFKNCSMNGEIQFYNYRKNALVKTLKPSDEIISAAFKVKGMKQMFAIADSAGDVSLWQTSLFI
ncbi:cytoplasmic dynein 2 intermediate chain 2-like [Planococcus citri]|uniref:cytoplasmic dynein 2 intermediate chain 2-like n=1 Tax=Planococcus citri TaxID=170843 RepID=UPI0031FA0972